MHVAIGSLEALNVLNPRSLLSSGCLDDAPAPSVRRGPRWQRWPRSVARTVTP